MNFNFQQLKGKYEKKSKKQQLEQQAINEQLSLLEDLKVNPLVLIECEKLQKDYVTYYNNNRYFYLHTEPQNINIIDKIKKDQFSQIRKRYQKSLTPELSVKKQSRNASQINSQYRANKKSHSIKYRNLAFLFRKNIRIIIEKLKRLKITFKDIFQKNIFSDKPYSFGKGIFEAVKSGQDTKVWRMYIQNRFAIFSIDSTGKTLLTWACIRGYTAIVQMLIGMGIDVIINKQDLHGHSALYYALSYKNSDCVKILLLNQAAFQPKDVALSQEQKKLKNIVQLSLSIMKIIKKMPYEKRMATFQQRLKHLG